MRRKRCPLEAQRSRLCQLQACLRGRGALHEASCVVTCTGMRGQHRPQPQRTEVTRIEGQGQIKASCGLLEVAVPGQRCAQD
ncbi:MAG: hypothetical protein ACK559_21505, partial [bacterium]